jgi:superfamily II DNA or RNA helicase
MLPRLTIDPAWESRVQHLASTARSRHGTFSQGFRQHGVTCRHLVRDLVVDGAGRLVAHVENGPQAKAHEIQLDLDRTEDSGRCSCSVGEGGRCKHVWAVLDRFVAAAGQRIGDDNAKRRGQGGPPPPREGGAPHGGDGGGRGDVGRGRDGGGRHDGRGRDNRGGPPRGAPPAPRAPDRGRVVWRVGRAAGAPTLEVLEEARRSDGSWAPGRKIPPDQLRDPALWTRPDIEAVAKLLPPNDDPRGAGATLDAGAALELLIGAPFVTWVHAPNKRVTIARAEPAVRLVPASNGAMRLEPVLGDRALEPGELGRRGPVGPGGPGSDDQGADVIVVALEPQTDRVLVGRVEPRTAAVLQQLAATRPEIAPGGGLAARLLQLERLVPVRLPAGLSLPVVQGDERVRLGLAFRGEQIEAGVRATLRMRPLDLGGGALGGDQGRGPGDAGPALAPGEGQAELLGASAQLGLARVRRGLAAETAAANAAAATLGLAGKLPASPWTWELDYAGTLALLDAANKTPGVLVEWADQRRVIGSRLLEPSDLHVKIDDKGDWFDVDGALLVDGERVSLAIVLAALRAGSAMLKLPGGRTLRLSDALRKKLEALRDAVQLREGRLEVDAVSAPLVRDALSGAGGLDVSAAWTTLLERFDAAQTVSTKAPAGLKAELRPYQQEGWAWLKRLSTWGAGACLADDMGLGKTVQAIAVLLDRSKLGPALVVAPTSVSDNWCRELARFAPGLRAVLLRETDRAETTLKDLGPKDVLIASYDLARIDGEELAKIQWATLVLDEAQRVKNATTKTSQALSQLKAGWRMALTGTPIENNLGELWSLFRLISPGLLGTMDHFRERWSKPIEADGDVTARAGLARKIRPFVLRRVKSEVASFLPPRTDVRRDVTLSEPERALYDAARLEAVRKLERLIGGGTGQAQQGAHMHVLAALTRLRQLACHPGLVDEGWKDGSAKLETLVDLVTSLKEGGHHALIFSQFTSLLDLVAPAFEAAGLRFVRLDGRTPAKDRTKAIDAFQAGQADAFLVSLKAGGTGLNLTAADHVVHLDPWWNPAVEDQATDRAHRIGQERPVTVFRLVAKDTIEEQILALHADKRGLVNSILEGTDTAGSLSTGELLELIRGIDPAKKKREERKPEPEPEEDEAEEDEDEEEEDEEEATEKKVAKKKVAKKKAGSGAKARPKKKKS